MKEERLEGWNEYNGDYAIEIKDYDTVTASLFDDHQDRFDPDYSLIFTVYHLQLHLLRIEDILENFPANC